MAGRGSSGGVGGSIAGRPVTATSDLPHLGQKRAEAGSPAKDDWQWTQTEAAGPAAGVSESTVTDYIIPPSGCGQAGFPPVTRLGKLANDGRPA